MDFLLSGNCLGINFLTDFFNEYLVYNSILEPTPKS